jgi:hypothetical protein
MGRTVLVVLLVCLVASPVAGNEPPLADAGLDQQVQRGAVVLLDAAGSRDPDGTVATTAWRVEAPNGTTFAPRCADCTRARFPANRLGTYTVTLTVTDDDGATRTDQLRVRVERRTRPAVTVTGPATVDRGDNRTYRARLAAPNGSLTQVVWTVGGQTVARQPLSGERATQGLVLRHPYPGRLTVRATVSTASGHRANGSHTVRVVESFVDQPPGPGAPGLPAASSGRESWSLPDDVSRADGREPRQPRADGCPMAGRTTSHESRRSRTNGYPTSS